MGSLAFLQRSDRPRRFGPARRLTIPLRHLALVVAVVLVAATAVTAGAQCRCRGGAEPGGCCAGGRPCGPGGGCARGAAAAVADDDHAVFHFLLDARERIRREVTELSDGVETLTESDDPEVANKIGTHVRAMYARMKDGRPIHARDPLFAELFRHADAIAMTIEPTPRGLRVRETSSDPWVAKLIQAHAEVVSRFLANGHAEMRRNHDLPPR